MTKRVPIIIIMLAMLTAQASQDLLKEGKKLLDDGFVADAEIKLLEAVKADPSVAEAHFLLSKVYLRKYDLVKTNESLLQAIEHDKANQDYRDEFENIKALASSMTNAMRSLNGGDPDDAISKFEKVIEDYPEYAAAGLY